MKHLNYADLFRAQLDSHDFIYREKNNDSGIRFSMSITCDKVPQLRIACIVRPNGQVTLISYPANNIAEAKRPAMLRIVNQLNNDLRYVNFHLDEDWDLCAEFDYIVYPGDPEQVGRHMFRMLILASDIIDNAMPKILTELWKADDEEDEEEDDTEECEDTLDGSSSELLNYLLDTLPDSGDPE